jgi:hypothetical protein
MITVAVPFWDANEQSLPFSRHYTTEDVEKLYRGFARNLTVPFRFVCFTEKPREFAEPIWQERLSSAEPGYSACIEPYRLDEPMILVGLDTVIVGNCDELARYCLEGSQLAVPRDPFFPEKVCNGVALVPKGHGWVWSEFPGGNDMEWIRSLPVAVIDDLFPRQVVSYKGHTKHYGIEDETRIVYFHGVEKPAELGHLDWVAESWR